MENGDHTHRVPLIFGNVDRVSKVIEVNGKSLYVYTMYGLSDRRSYSALLPVGEESARYQYYAYDHETEEVTAESYVIEDISGWETESKFLKEYFRWNNYICDKSSNN